MRALLWLHDQAIHLYGAYKKRRVFRRHWLTDEAQQRLADAKKRTP